MGNLAPLLTLSTIYQAIQGVFKMDDCMGARQLKSEEHVLVFLVENENLLCHQAHNSL